LDLGNETDGRRSSYAMDINTGRKDIFLINMISGFHQKQLVPLTSKLTGRRGCRQYMQIGPGSQLVQGVIEQSVLFHVINQALDLHQRIIKDN